MESVEYVVLPMGTTTNKPKRLSNSTTTTTPRTSTSTTTTEKITTLDESTIR